MNDYNYLVLGFFLLFWFTGVIVMIILLIIIEGERENMIRNLELTQIELEERRRRNY